MVQRRKQYFESGANIFDIENMHSYESTKKLMQTKVLDSKCLLFDKVIPDTDECQKFETIRKKIHPNEDEDSQYLIETAKKQIYYNDNDKISQKALRVQRPFYAESISSTPLRQKYANLIPEYQSADYCLDHKLLIRIQGRIDEHLVCLKTYRGKKKGEFFKSLRKNLIQGSQIIMDLHHFKQIMFINSQLYICKRQKDKDNGLDILIDLPQDIDLNERKNLFKSQLFNYLQSQNAFQKGKKKYISIPQYKFPFQQQIQYQNGLLLIKRQEQLNEKQQQQAKQQNQLLSVKNFFLDKDKYQKNLVKKIQEASKKSKQLAQNTKRYGREEILKVIDQIYLIYTSKAICNMFRGTLTQLIAKKLLILDDVIIEIVQFIIQNGLGYLKKIQHKKGLILQIDSKKYRTFRDNIKEMNA